MDRYDPTKQDIVKANLITKVKSANDTTAYLTALTAFYDEKVNQRSMHNYGEPKGFLIVDKNNIDLSLKLSEKMVKGFEAQVTSKPEVKKMLDEYIMDSISVN